MQLTKYKLGDLITQRREKNKDYDLPIRGVSREGFIKPKIEEADTSIYNVFYKNDFVFNPARMELNSIALNLDLDKALCSSLYEVFYVKDENVVLPEFLNLHIKRDEFARHCDYIGLGSAREYCRFANIAEFDIMIPPIEIQREIVQADRQIKRRIRLNEQMIEKLEATAQALYRKMFVDGIDKENLPEGWSMGTLSDIAIITMGQSPDGETYNIDGDGMIFYQGRTDFGRRFPKARVYTTSPTREAEIGDVLLSVRAPVGDLNIAPHKCCLGRGLAGLRSKMKCQSYLYYQMVFLSDVFKVSDDEGTIFGSINKDDLYNIEVVVPNKQTIELFNNVASIIDNQIRILDGEIASLQELQSLLLAKMGNLKQ